MTKAFRSTFALLFLVSTLGNAPIAIAKGDPDAGATKATACGACHGANGISNNEMWPHLAGQRETYLVTQIKAFRDGTRNEPTMLGFVANLSDQDIEDLAAFYTNLSPCP